MSAEAVMADRKAKSKKKNAPAQHKRKGWISVISAILLLIGGVLGAGFSDGIKAVVSDAVKALPSRVLTIVGIAPTNPSPFVVGEWKLTVFYGWNVDARGSRVPVLTTWTTMLRGDAMLSGTYKGDNAAGTLSGILRQKELVMTYGSDDPTRGYGTLALQKVDILDKPDVFVGVAIVRACRSLDKNACVEAGPHKICRAILSRSNDVLNNRDVSRYLDSECWQLPADLTNSLVPTKQTN
jgi:hypothetical protein